MAETPNWLDLKKIPLFSELTEQEIYQVMKLSFSKQYAQGSTLFLEGMPGEVLYIVKHGKVDILKKSPQGEVLLSSLGEGEFLGEMSLIDDSPRSATARVAVPSELIVITRKCFQDMLKGDPHISAVLLMHFLKVMGSRLRATDKRLELH